jgi:hypothetical protein
VKERQATPTEVTTAPIEDRGTQVRLSTLSLDTIKLRVDARKRVLHDLDGFLPIVDE